MGKTFFLDWFLYRSQYCEYIRSESFFIDLGSRAAGRDEDATLQLWKKELTGCMKKFLSVHSVDPCHDIRDQFENEFQLNMAYDQVCSKFRQKQNKFDKCMKVFVDDIDYIDSRFLPPLIETLRPVIDLSNCRIILAVRPPAYNTIIGHSDVSMAALFGGSSYTIELEHLDTEDIVNARLRFICSEEKQSMKEVYEREPKLLDSFSSLGKRIWQLFLDPDLPKQEDVETIKLPFTETQYYGMQQLSNGNIRYILGMCKEYLRYMKENAKQIQEGTKGYHIGRKAFINHFSGEEIWGRIRIQNIHKRKSHQFLSREETRRRRIPIENVGNSLYVVLLESLAQFQSINATRIAALEGFGFSEREVNEGVDELLDMEMIEEQKIIDRRPLGGGESIVKDMKVTKRGKYYLGYMMHWPEYIEKYGCSEHHKRGTSILARESMKVKLLELVATIMLTREQMYVTGKDFKVSKRAFWKFFLDITQPIRTMLDMTNGVTPIPVTEKTLESFMRDLGIIKTKRLTRVEHYLFYYREVQEACENRKVPWNMAYTCTAEKGMIRSFIEASVVTPEYEEEK